MDYNGGQKTKIIEDKSLDPSKYHGFGLALINNILYWSDWQRHFIYSLKQTKPNATIVKFFKISSTKLHQGVMGIVAVDDSRQPKGIFF